MFSIVDCYRIFREHLYVGKSYICNAPAKPCLSRRAADKMHISFSKILIQSNLFLKTAHWEEKHLVFVHRWSIVKVSFEQKMSNWEVKSVVV